MSLILPNRFNQQPQQAVKIDCGNPLTQGLVAAIYVVNGVFYDAISGQIAKPTGTFRPRQTVDGNAVAAISSIGGSGAAPKFANQIGTDLLTSNFTLFAEGCLETNASTTEVFKSWESNNGRGVGLVFDDNSQVTNGFVGRINNSLVANYASTNSALGANSEQFTHRIAWSSDGVNKYSYAKGLLNRTVADSVAATADSTRRTYLHSVFDPTSGQTGSSVSLLLAFNRAITLPEYQALYANPWQVFKAPQRRLWIGSAGTGTQTLTPSLFSNATTFYAPTVAAGAVGLTPGLFSNTNSFYAPTVSSTYALTPGLFSNSNSFYAPTVAASYSITAGLFTNSATFYSHVVSGGEVILTPGLFSNSQTFYAPTVALASGPQTLTAGLFGNTNTFYAPDVTLQNQILAPALFENQNTFYSSSVSVDVVAQGMWWYGENLRKDKRKKLDKDELEEIKQEIVEILEVPIEQSTVEVKKKALKNSVNAISSLARNINLFKKSDQSAVEKFISNLEVKQARLKAAIQQQEEDDEEESILLLLN